MYLNPLGCHKQFTSKLNNQIFVFGQSAVFT